MKDQGKLTKDTYIALEMILYSRLPDRALELSQNGFSQMESQSVLSNESSLTKPFAFICF